LFCDVHRQGVALHEVLGTEEILSVLGERLPGAALGGHLRQLLAGQWSDLWLKAPTYRRPPPGKQATIYPKGGHTSVVGVLQQARANRRVKEPTG
jgi:hypothetical protein